MSKASEDFSPLLGTFPNFKLFNFQLCQWISVADPGFFVGGDALLRNGVIDW